MPLVLDSTERGYVITPDQDTTIKAWFGDHALPVINVDTYTLVLQSSNIHIESQPWIFEGKGFTEMPEAACRSVN